MKAFFYSCVSLLFFLLAFTYVNAQQHIALVLGNSNYQDAPLRNPINDATDMASVLRDLGFTVILNTNLDQQTMEEAVRDFSSRINSGDIALFYYSGHGVQVEGLNYLIPVGAKINAENEVKYKCMEAQFVLDKLQSAHSSVNIIILDACRDNPFKGFRSLNRGFVPIIAPSGTIISYSTAPGRVAADGTGRNSPYTSSLLRHIKEPGLQVEEMFKEVRKEVMDKTGQYQIPWESSSLVSDYSFVKGNKVTEVPSQTAPIIAENNANISFKSGTPCPGMTSFTDPRDGQVYPTVKIGKQCWMKKNMNYKMENSWCYDDSESNCDIYGRLYDWKTAMKVCPRGWHLPTNAEWNQLAEYLGGNGDAGGKMKEEGTTHWFSPNTGASNSSGFVALPGGFMKGNGEFKDQTTSANFWTSSETNAYSAWYRCLIHNDVDLRLLFIHNNYGFSCRCLRD